MGLYSITVTMIESFCKLVNWHIYLFSLRRQRQRTGYDVSVDEFKAVVQFK